jgi:hypothetical protein
LGARYYDPSIARFTQVDAQSGELQQPVSLNRYLYVGDNPLNGRDCSGTSYLTECIKGAVVEGLVGALIGGVAGAAKGCIVELGIEFVRTHVSEFTGTVIGVELNAALILELIYEISA